MDCIADLRNLLDRSERTVFFSGAGISTESGIPDYRTPQKGLWANLASEDYLNIDSFTANPERFYTFFAPLFDVFRNALPNSAHAFIGKREAEGKTLSVITQNIDGLHHKAGSKTVHELHGSLMTSRCMRCDEQMATTRVFRILSKGENPPKCPACGGVMRPDVIFFGEMLPPAVMDNAVKDSMNCDLFIVAGSSLSVMPAAMLPGYAKSSGAKVVIINKMPTPYDGMADLVINRSLGEVFKSVEVV
jgi:NAD-dependent deacetylase